MPSTICSPTVNAGLSEVIGSWKIIEMRSPRSSRIAPAESLQQIGAVEADRAGCDPARGRGNQTHDRQRGDALAAARFADEPERASGLEREAHAVDRGELAGLDGERRPEAFDLEQRSHQLEGWVRAAWKRCTSLSIVARSVIPAGRAREGRQATKG